jgi:exopolyphosphatase/guanosine-5'-triphosphate,3'-diphosphate pyrophosphatase
MRCACVDIGSNTTRVLVADIVDGRLAEVASAKAFTRLGRELRRTGSLPAVVLDAVAGVVAEQHALAVGAGAQRIQVVATAAIRHASNGAELVRVVWELSGLEVEVLTGEEEARLAFLGATCTHDSPLPGTVAVVDVGGGSSEIAVGTLAGGVEWCASVPVGSASLAEACLRSDPPQHGECRRAVERAAGAFEAIDVPRVDHAIAVGGSATSTAQLVGTRIDEASIGGAMGVLRSAPAAEVARVHGLDPERVRVLPAGLYLLGAAVRRLGRPLEVGRGGLREGACLRLGIG